MEKVSYWAKTLRSWLPFAVGLNLMYLITDVIYVQELYTTGRDPFYANPEWIWALPFSVFGLLSGIIDLLILVFLICFMLRSAQLIKSLKPDEFVKRPGWAIWGFFIPVASIFIPYQVLSAIKNFAKSDEAEDAQTRKLLLLFWIPNVLSSYLATRSFLTGGLDPSFQELQTQSLLDAFVSLLSLISWIFLIQLLPRIFDGIQKRLSEISDENQVATS